VTATAGVGTPTIIVGPPSDPEPTPAWKALVDAQIGEIRRDISRARKKAEEKLRRAEDRSKRDVADLRDEIGGLRGTVVRGFAGDEEGRGLLVGFLELLAIALGVALQTWGSLI